MIIKFSHSTNILEINDQKIKASCDVRNELNKRRLPEQVIFTIPDQLPYYPRIFPVGNWNIYEAVPTDNKEMAPYIIRTNAQQPVDVWEIRNGRYYQKTGKINVDRGYHVHLLAMYKTTQGCIGIKSPEDIIYIFGAVSRALKAKEIVTLEVTA